MSIDPADYVLPLDRAHEAALRWLESVPDRPVRPSAGIDELLAAFAGPLPEHPFSPAEVIDELVDRAEPGLMAIPSGRFFGWVMGGTLPAALAADWMLSAWDQNSGLRYATPATAAIEHTAGRWLLDLLGLPAGSAVGFTTGGTMANFAGLAAGRDAVLDDAGWDVSAHGLQGAPRIRVLAGADRHSSVDLALRYLGLGAPTLVDADDQGRIIPAALAAALDLVDGPTLVVLQAGNLHSGAFDPMGETIRIAHEHGAWVHVDGAFGLWAAASPRLRDRVAGVGDADSWATDAHKTLNVPYDCGVAIVARPERMRTALGVHASYLPQDPGAADPLELVPEMSRRGRGVPVWAALRSLGRAGAIALVERLVGHAGELARRLDELDGVEVLNEVAFTQVSLSFGSDDRTRAVTAALIEDGAVWMSGSHWAGRDILRISVSNWSTDDADVDVAVDAVRRAMLV